ncbi:MAG: CoA transferase [Acidimicrobiia bacterium]|nr:CoA transferase [Acidimicrobiia bacterium]
MTDSTTDSIPGVNRPPGALDGIRLIDLTTVLMGPMATRMLADHGADVIRIEPLAPQSTRHSPPWRTPGMNGFTLNLQRNKRSIALDLKHPDGAAAAAELIAGADVVVSNMRRSALVRLGLDADTLRARHPGLIHCTANGFGSGGPYADRAAYDDVIQASSGLANLHERVDGQPRLVPSVIADKVCGMTIAQAVLAAVVHKVRTGEGQTVEVPMFETMVAFNLVEHHRGHAFEPPIGDIGYVRLLNPYRRPFKAADGWVCLLPYTDADWTSFFTFVGHPELIDDPRFVTHSTRLENIEALYEFLGDMAALHTVEEWLRFAESVSIPASPVLDLAEVHDDPQVVASDLMPVAEHPTEGSYRMVNDSVRYSASPTTIRRHAPYLGQHTRQVLSELGWTVDRIDRLLADGAAAEGEQP